MCTFIFCTYCIEKKQSSTTLNSTLRESVLACCMLLLLPALNRLQKYPDDDGVQKVALAIENFHTPHQ